MSLGRINDFLQYCAAAPEYFCCIKFKKMFTLQQIKDAHSRVKSGADFPRYVNEIKNLGLNRYEYMVADGNTIYYGDDGYKIESGARYGIKAVALISSAEALKHTITIHQQGKTDFPTFCDQSAAAGVEKWVVDAQKMACIYYDLAGTELVYEPIPQGDYA